MKPSKQIEAEVRQLETDFRNRDLSFFDRVSRQPGVLGIGSDPKEWFPSHERLTEVFGTQMENMPPFEFTTHKVAAYEEGDVGWAAMDATWSFPSSPKMDPLATRITLVFNREDGAWKIVLFQTSFAFPDADVFRGMAS
ncbi:MAG: nuclear transport factor 2 family protein [Deinococcales bacterium]